MTLYVLSPWTGAGTSTEDAFRRQFQDDYPAVERVEDVTGQPNDALLPSPNLTLIRVTCTEAEADAIAADPRYADAIVAEE